MEFSELMRCNHKVKKIKVNNENKHSLFNNVVLKISIPDIKNDETVMFSAEPNDNFLAYQRSDNDFFCIIPNKLNSVSIIYAHFLPSDLYDYDETEMIFSIYNFAEIFDENRKDFFGNPYTVTTKLDRYKASLDEEGRLIVQSVAKDNKINDHYDPNYKNFLSNDANKTQQGFFPLSSKYRPTQNWKVPNLSDFNPKWEREDGKPYWETRIHRTGLSPLITGSALDDIPINVFLSYDYLPTSREYHQHYYGFEGEKPNKNTINVLEGENLHKIDSKFAEHKATSEMKDSDKYNNYRLITLNNPYDDTKSFYVDHEKIIPIELKNFMPNYINNTPSCEWIKDKCHDFYVYRPININTTEQKYCELNIELNNGQYYNLRYFMYIPTQANVANNECQIIVQTKDHTYQTHQKFIHKDKEMRNQWIYHEVSFLASEMNTIKIIGPQNIHPNNLSNSIYFSNISLQKIDTYSPTLQYSKYGVQLTEQGESTSRYEETSNLPVDEESPTTPPLPWSEYNIKLEYPYDEVYITVNDEEYLYYEKRTGDLKFSGPSGHIIYRPEDENDNTKNNFGSATSNIDLSYVSTGEKEGEITATYINNITGVYGPNNKYTFTFKDSNNNFVKKGTVEVGLVAEIDETETLSGALMKFKQRPVDVNETVTFSNIDFTDIQPNTTTPKNKYFLKIIYHNICQEVDKIVFKPIYLEPETVTISELRINGETTNTDGKSIIDNGYRVTDASQVPIDIRVKVTDQKGQGKTTGYCELSINDKLHQSTIIDDDEWADFYIAPEDVEVDCYVIKIEYYREYNKSLAFIYFDLCIDSLDAIKPYVDIDILLWTKGEDFTKKLPNNELIIADNDCVLASVTTRQHSQFRLEIYRTNLCTNKTELLFAKNIFNKIDRTINFIHAEQNDLSPYKFTFITGNMYDDTRTFKKDIKGNDVIDQEGNVILDIYRDYEKSYTIKKQTHQNCN